VDTPHKKLSGKTKAAILQKGSYPNLHPESC